MNFIKINEILYHLNEQINFLELEEDDSIVRSEKALQIIIKAYDFIKKIILKSNFKTQNEEIEFFKNIKPQLTSKLIFYNSIYKIETKKPFGGDRTVIKYYRNELHKIKRYFDNNIDFYKYYRTGSTYLDHKYFVRGNAELKFILESFFFEADRDFSTSHDFKVGKIIAHDLLEVFLENRILAVKEVKKNNSGKANNDKKMVWTASKVSLVELIYALHSEGVFNNGKIDIKDLVNFFETEFDIELGQYRRVFLEIRQRKSEQTKFLSAMQKSLIKRMEDADDN